MVFTSCSNFTENSCSPTYLNEVGCEEYATFLADSISSTMSSSSSSDSTDVGLRECSYTLLNIPTPGSGNLACPEKVYKTVTMGEQVWMADNVDFGERIPKGDYQSDATGQSAEKHCFDDSQMRCDDFGGLYQWNTAMALPYSCNTTMSDTEDCVINTPHQGICPNGWHVPTKDEWEEFWEWVDEDNGGAEEDEVLSLVDGELYGLFDGTDAYGWNGIPGGIKRDVSYSELGWTANWWTVDEPTASGAVSITMDYHYDYIKTIDISKYTQQIYLRCLKD